MLKAAMIARIVIIHHRYFNEPANEHIDRLSVTAITKGFKF